MVLAFPDFSAGAKSLGDGNSTPRQFRTPGVLALQVRSAVVESA